MGLLPRLPGLRRDRRVTEYDAEETRSFDVPPGTYMVKPATREARELGALNDEDETLLSDEQVEERRATRRASEEELEEFAEAATRPSRRLLKKYSLSGNEALDDWVDRMTRASKFVLNPLTKKLDGEETGVYERLLLAHKKRTRTPQYERWTRGKLEAYIEERYGPELRGEVPQERLAVDHPLTAKYGSWQNETIDWDSAPLPKPFRGAKYEGQVTGALYPRAMQNKKMKPPARGLAMHGLGVFTFGRHYLPDQPEFPDDEWRRIAPARIGAARGYMLPEGSRYEGEFRNGAAHGYGILKVASAGLATEKTPGATTAQIWGGQWIEGMRHGCGIKLDLAKYNAALRSGKTHAESEHLIRDTYGLWKLDSFSRRAVFPWEMEPNLVVGQHFGKHEDMFEADGLPRFDELQMTSILNEQEENHNRRAQMQTDEFNRFLRRNLRYDYCKVGDAWQSFRHAMKNAEMARTFENKPGGQAALQSSFRVDERTGDKVFVKRENHPLFYPLGTQCLMPGPMGQLFTVPEELRRAMSRWARWTDWIHARANFDPRDPPYPRGWERAFDGRLAGMMRMMQAVRDDRTAHFEEMKDGFRRRIAEGDFADEDELKLMRWVLHMPKPRAYPIGEEASEEFTNTPEMERRWYDRVRNRAIKPLPKDFFQLGLCVLRYIESRRTYPQPRGGQRGARTQHKSAVVDLLERCVPHQTQHSRRSTKS